MVQEENKKYSNLAIISFILSLIILPMVIQILLSFVNLYFYDVFFITSNNNWSFIIFYFYVFIIVLTIILSIISLKIILQQNLKGKIFAIISLIISIIGFLLLIYIIYSMSNFHMNSLNFG